MHKGKMAVSFLTVLLLILAAGITILEHRSEAEHAELVSVLVKSDKNNIEEVVCWEREAGEYFVFLPSYIE